MISSRDSRIILQETLRKISQRRPETLLGFLAQVYKMTWVVERLFSFLIKSSQVSLVPRSVGIPCTTQSLNPFSECSPCPPELDMALHDLSQPPLHFLSQCSPYSLPSAPHVSFTGALALHL